MSIERFNKAMETDPDSTNPAKQKPQHMKSREQRYSHKYEFLDIEKDMVSLVAEMKERIEENYYDAILSDEVGGRIPTLILRKIITERNNLKPDKPENPATYFVNFGRDSLDEQALTDFFKKTSLAGKRILLVTEAIETGSAIVKAIDFLKTAGIEDVEIATVVSAGSSGLKRFVPVYGGWNKEKREYEKRMVDASKIKGKTVFSGKVYAKHSPLLDRSGPRLTGVEKEIRDGQIVGAHPKRLDAIKAMNIPDYRPNKTRANYVTFSGSSEKQQENINTARKDVNTIAQFIMRKVWKKT